MPRLLDGLTAARVSDDDACAGRFATSHGREYDAPRPWPPLSRSGIGGGGGCWCRSSHLIEVRWFSDVILIRPSRSIIRLTTSLLHNMKVISLTRWINKLDLHWFTWKYIYQLVKQNKHGNISAKKAFAVIKMRIHFLLDRWPPPTGPSPTEAIHPSIRACHAKLSSIPPLQGCKEKTEHKVWSSMENGQRHWKTE